MEKEYLSEQLLCGGVSLELSYYRWSIQPASSRQIPGDGTTFMKYGWNIWLEEEMGFSGWKSPTEMQMEILDWNPGDFWPVIEIELPV